MRKIISLLMVFVSMTYGFSQSTIVADPNFNPLDTGNNAGDGPSSGLEKIAKLQDGSYIIVGNFTKYNDKTVGRIAKIKSDGSLDESFNVGGAGAAATISDIKLQSDGKIIIAGSFLSYNGTAISRIARLNADGTLDTSFNVGTGFNNAVSLVNIQSDGKIIAVGNFTMFNDFDAFRVVRLNTNGSLDENFDTSIGVNNAVAAMAIDAAGRILIGGNFTSVNDVPTTRLARLLSDGTLDTTFNVGTGPASNVSTISLDGNKIYLGGSFNTYNGVESKKMIRLNEDGSVDSSFNVGTGFNDGVYKIVPSGNKIYAFGNFISYNGTSASRALRLNEDGSLDTTFNPDQPGAGGSILDFVILDDTHYIATGYFSVFNGIGKQYIVKFNEAGDVDLDFNKGVGINKDVYSAVVLDDKSIIYGGSFTIVNNSVVKNLAKTDEDGNVDAAFVANLGHGFNNTVIGVKKLSSGKIAVAGDFTKFNGEDQQRVVILNTDGTKDNSFVTTGFGGSISAFEETDNGKIVFAGSFTTYNGTTINRIARVNSDGSLDTTFDVGTGSGSTINAIAKQADGKIIIGGSFNSFNGTTTNRIARLNTDGSVDSTFNIGTGANFPISAISVLADGKILISGNFTQFNGIAVNRIARLNADGSFDSTFNVGTGLNATATLFNVQPDGKIIVVGDFATYNGNTVNRIFRINDDGIYDNLFDVGTSANGTIRTAVFQEDQKLIIGGAFTNFGGVGKNRLARLLFTEESLAVNVANIGTSAVLYPNPVQSVFNIQSSQNIKGGSIYDASGRLVSEFTGNIGNAEILKPGIYYIRTWSEDGKINSLKFIKK